MSEFRRLAMRFALATLLVLGCATEDGSDVADNGGMSGTGISKGSIDSFGSIFVNGVEWDLAGAAIEIDGAVATEGDLRVGMFVRVVGSLSPDETSGTATDVSFDERLVGPLELDPVETVAGLQAEFRVLGTTVVIDATTTVFDGTGFATLSADDVVVVSGAALPGDRIAATRVEQVGTFPAATQAELEGIVANRLSSGPNAGSFELGPILVRYDPTTVFDGVDAGTLMNGDRVDVEGTLRVSGTELDATEIRLAAVGLGVTDADDVELEGVVDDFVSIADFSVEDVPVDASAATFDPPGAAAMLADGVAVEIEGRLEGGVLIADEVVLDDPLSEDVLFEAEVSAIDGVARQLTLLSIDVEVPPEALFEDERDESANFGFDDLVVGDWLIVVGRVTSGGAIEAASVVREEAGDDVVLRGPVENLAPLIPAFDVLGLAIPIDAGTAYFDADGESRSEAEFFGPPGDVSEGSVVTVTDVGATDGGSLLEADEVSLETDD